MTAPLSTYINLFPIAYMVIWAIGVISMAVAYRNATRR